MDNKLLQPGTMLRGGTYRVERPLSSGGFGNTYVVTNVSFDETFAMKEFYMKDINMRDGNSVTVSIPGNKTTFDTQRNKFLKEAKRLRKLTNNHIVGVHDLFEENGTTYYIMDFIDGESLSARMKRTGQPLSEAETMDVLNQVLEALDVVHQQGIWHLDLKPANIMINKEGKALLIDFGASKQMRADEGLTSTSGLCYTPGYAPIEQMEQNLDRFGPWTDIYSLGATLYNLLTRNALPSPMELLEEGESALQFPPTVSPKMRQLVYRMMQPSRLKRPQSIAEVRQLLKGEKPAVSEETVVGTPKPAEEETRVISTPKPATAKPATAKAAAPKPVAPKPPSTFNPPPSSKTPPPSTKTPIWPFIAIGAVVLLLLGVGGVFLGTKLLKSSDNREVAVVDSIAAADSVVTDQSLTAQAMPEPAEQTTPSAPVRETPETAPAPVKPEKPMTQETPPASNTRQTEAPVTQTQQTTQNTATKEEVSADNTVHDVVEQMPSFPGGQAAMMNYLSKSIKYPVVAEENGIQGRVIVSFVVEKDGSISGAKVVKSVDPSLDKEALRLVRSMPRWTPGRQDGKPVRVKYNVPITFRLS